MLSSSTLLDDVVEPEPVFTVFVPDRVSDENASFAPVSTAIALGLSSVAPVITFTSISSPVPVQ